MAKTRTVYVCQQCNSQQTRWMGRCPDCNAWDSLVEQVERKEGSGAARRASPTGNAPVALRDVATGGFARLPVHSSEFARVLGGGLVPGSLVLLGGDPGIGKCVTGDTRVLDPLTGALRPIQALAEQPGSVLALDPATYNLTPALASHWHNQGTRTIVEVETQLGRRLRCTLNHPLLTPDGWQLVEALSVGTRIATPRTLPFFGQEPMAEHEVKLIAYVLSDGCAQSTVNVVAANPAIAADLHTVAAAFSMQLRTYAKTGTKAVTYQFVTPRGERAVHRQTFATALQQVKHTSGLTWSAWARKAGVEFSTFFHWRAGTAVPNSAQLAQLAEAAGVPIAQLAPDSRRLADQTNPVAALLERVGVRYTTAANKAVPECIFRLPKAQIALFLKLLFSCDGSVYVTKAGIPALSYSTISRRLAEDVQHLLLRFGFVTKLRTKRQRVREQPYTAYELQMLGVAEVQRYLAEIGIYGRESAQAQIRAQSVPQLASTHFDTIPTDKPFWQALAMAAPGLSHRTISAHAGVTLRNRRHTQPLTRSTVAAIARTFPEPHLNRLALSDVYWDRIERITPVGEAPVYDLSVPGHANFLANDLIVHNSSLLGELAAHFADQVGPALYVSAEESTQQIKLRMGRMGLDPEHLYLYAETSLDAAIAQIEQMRPRLAIVDSIQTVYSEDVTSAAGSVSQVREGALRLMRTAKETGTPILLVGHVTKEGAIAGPRVLEHIVDVVLYLEGERFHQYRLLRSVKNRFGSTNEVGVFEMTQEGMREVPNPSQVFLAERSAGTPGSAVAVTMEGTRPILCEVQALTSTTANPQPRRTANGFDPNRLQMLIAVLSKRVGLPLFNQDIYVNIVGGLRISEPAADLAVATAIASSFRNQKVKPDMALVGEVGLSGELRSTAQLDRRLAEAAKLGFGQALAPATTAAPRAEGMTITQVRALADAIDAALDGERPRRRATVDDEG